MKDVTIVDMNEPYVGDENVDHRKNFAVGYGRQLDENGDIFSVRIFLTSQKSKLFII